MSVRLRLRLRLRVRLRVRVAVRVRVRARVGHLYTSTINGNIAVKATIITGFRDHPQFKFAAL